VGSADVNEYLRDVTGEGFTAKDFRAWGGTVLALAALRAAGAVCAAAQEGEAGEDCAAGSSAPGANREREARRAIVEAVKRVAAQLGNRPATCRKYYVHPAVIAAFLDGRLERTVRRLPPPGSLPELEALTLALLRGLPPGALPATEGGKKRAPRKLPERRRRPRDPAGPLGANLRSVRAMRSTRSVTAASPSRLRR
jgi:DNA topoisomerase-1